MLIFVVKIAECAEAQKLFDDFLNKIDPLALEDDVDLVFQCSKYNKDQFKPLLRIKVNTERYTIKVKKKVEHIISACFDLTKFSLHFKSIKEGCVQFNYHVSKATASYLLRFKVTSSIIADFATHNIISIHIDDMILSVLYQVSDMVSNVFAMSYVS